MNTQKSFPKSWTYCRLFLIFTLVSSIMAFNTLMTSYAQPLFPPRLTPGGANIASSSNNTSQSEGNQTVEYTDNELLAFAGLHLINALRALQTNDTNSISGNLNTSQQQLELVASSPESVSGENSETEILASAGTNMLNAMRAIQTNDTNYDYNNNLRTSLSQYGSIVGIPVEVLLQQYNEPESEDIASSSNNTSQSEGNQPVEYTENELLAFAGIHLLNALRVFPTNDKDSFNDNLITSWQQFESVLTSS